MILTKNQFDPNAYWSEPTSNVELLRSPSCVDLFDQNGYHLTKAEQAFAENNNYPLIGRRHETLLRQDWLKWGKVDGAHINHSDIFERKGYTGDALTQLKTHADTNPLLFKLIKMKPKWGIDISIDYVSKDHVFEVFHYEWDSFDYGKVVMKKKEIEEFILSKNWDEEAEKLIELKDKWYNLPFFEQTEWRTDYFGLEPEKFKNVIWED